jgi:hypothetical protein
MLAAVLGFLTLHIVERSVAIHRGHEGEQGEYAGHLHAPGLGIFAASALVVHSLLDGVAIGAGFQAGSTVGAVVAIAVLSHDFADGFNTYTITSLYGNDRRRPRPRHGCCHHAPGNHPAGDPWALPRGSSPASSSTWHPPTSFLSTFVMVRHNRADEKRTDIHERCSFSTSASIAPSVPPPRHSPHG